MQGALIVVSTARAEGARKEGRPRSVAQAIAHRRAARLAVQQADFIEESGGHHARAKAALIDGAAEHDLVGALQLR